MFTNWGRIGDDNGQYQNTPFGKEEQAILEFEKIFKAKSGNEWKTLVTFTRETNNVHLTFYRKKIRKVSYHYFIFI